MRNTDKMSIFITGAGSGIGAATARLFTTKGWRVGLADRDGPAVQKLAKDLGDEAHAFTVDVLDRTSIEAALYGVPDLAVYSASKFAIRGLTEALNIEFEAKGIWVCDIMVGYVDTPMLSQAKDTAKSVKIAGVHVTSQMVADTVYKAISDRQVHWFVRTEDREASMHFDATPMEQRRDLIRPATGY